MPSYVRDREMADSTVLLKADRDGAATCHVDKLAETFPVQDCSLSISELDKELQGSKKTHHRSVTAVRVSDIMSSGGTNVGSNRDGISAASNQVVEGIAEEGHPNPNTSPHITLGDLSKESDSSSESNSTVTSSPPEKRKDRARRNTITKASPSPKHDAMDYLDSDSPRVTTESIQRSLRDSFAHHTPRTSSSSRSAASSLRSSPYSDGFSDNADHDTDWNTSPEQSPESKKPSIRPAPLSRRHKSYGTPEMPRGNVDFPHLSPEALTSRPLTHTQGHHHIKHLPRAEKLPLTGYEQLAFQLSGHGFRHSGPYLRPMYRRFETLNHRLLLHLQDEICELEEQLHRLDTADTQTRRLQNCILPASRRAEALSGGELQWHKTDILGKIGFKLEQYNRVLSSFKSTESFARPAMADVHEYRGYLATHSPIAEPETRFLDFSDDLICLVDPPEDEYGEDEDMAATPMPQRQSISFGPHKIHGDYFGAVEQPMVTACSDIPISLAMVVAVVVPVMTFSLIPGYLGRMVVAFLVGTGVLGALVQSQAVGTHGTKDFCICAGAYGITMAVVAGLYH